MFSPTSIVPQATASTGRHQYAAHSEVDNIGGGHLRDSRTGSKAVISVDIRAQVLKEKNRNPIVSPYHNNVKRYLHKYPNDIFCSHYTQERYNTASIDPSPKKGAI
ncbi:hypothetical protein KSX_17090 [Ktedonospora formicarum]|uniref:Uncharacterized protein n=1 Tax=Ktedonospora formicarum TaxID=2778364 RepID=A0A8J3HWZ4_9CHLR|nr:hypothetical protein KSX_17090 [Ktedonospora formicarum]